jgi:acyl-CoA thioesterase
MSAFELLGLSATDDPARWRVHVHDGVVTGGGALQGGAALGAALEAMAHATGRPPLWASAQFVTFAAAGAELELSIEVALAGHRVTQARARLSEGAHEVLRAFGAFGAREADVEHTFAAPPRVPPPEACALRGPALPGWEIRLALGRASGELDGSLGAGCSASWFRRPGGRTRMSAGELALIGDCSVLELSDALGFACLGSSLDNTLRIAELAETEWVLLDARVPFAAHGFASLDANLWSDRGVLLGTFSQTLAVRRLDAIGSVKRTTKRYAGA